MPTEYATVQDMKRVNERLKILETKADSLSEHYHGIEKQHLATTHDLKQIITTAVTDGNQDLKKQFSDYTKTLDKQLCDIENRVHVLEDEKKIKALQELEQRQKDKKDSRKNIRLNIVLVVITFIVGMILNNFVALLNANKEYEEWKKLQNTNYRLQMKTEMLQIQTLEEMQQEIFLF